MAKKRTDPTSESTLSDCLTNSRPNESWWLDRLLTHAADCLEAARTQVPETNRISQLPASLLRQAGLALVIAGERLEGSGTFLEPAHGYHFDRKLARIGIDLAVRAPAKAVAGSTVGEVRERLGIPKLTGDSDVIDSDRPHIERKRLTREAPSPSEFREEANRAALSIEILELMVSRGGLPADFLGDFVDLADRAHAAAQRLVREIERRFSQNPVLRHIAGRSPRRRTPRRPRKAAAQKIDKATPEDQGADS